MQTWLMLGALVWSLGSVPVVGAEDQTLEERVKKLERLLKEREQRESEGVPRGVERPEITKPPGASGELGPGPLPDVGREQRIQDAAPLSFGSTGSGRLIYAKPFVSSPKAILGGYMDFFYTMTKKGPLTPQGSINNDATGNPGIGQISNSFDQQRFVPFIYADISDHLKMASEIEFEHGIRETSDHEIEVGIEFATLDYLVHERINFRGGIILLPVGKFNLLHDSPLNDLGPRPLMSTFVIPSTMSETGAGFYGTFYPGRTSKLDYELYLTTGPNGYQADGTPVITELNGLSGTRQRVSAASDGLSSHNGKTVVGRLTYSPMLGIEVAGSAYHGSYDPHSKRHLTIMAVDWTLQRGPFELIGEAAWAYAQGNSKLLDGTPNIDPLTGRLAPQRSAGYYIQGNYHFLPNFLKNFSKKHFGEGSTFTAAMRYDRVNTNLDRSGGLGDLETLTIGLNFRPLEDAVFRLAYQFNMRATNAFTNMPITGNNALILSMATYF
ncbi:MAG: hypothetical protein U0236_21065 [Nitrospira sp.]